MLSCKQQVVGSNPTAGSGKAARRGRGSSLGDRRSQRGAQSSEGPARGDQSNDIVGGTNYAQVAQAWALIPIAEDVRRMCGESCCR